MQKAKLEYKHAIRESEKESANSFSDELTESLLGRNMNNFWKSWNSKFKNNKNKKCGVLLKIVLLMQI